MHSDGKHCAARSSLHSVPAGDAVVQYLTERNCPYIDAVANSIVITSVGFMHSTWAFSMVLQFPPIILVLRTIACVVNKQKESTQMKKIIDKSFLLMVGTSLLGRPVSGMFPTLEER